MKKNEKYSTIMIIIIPMLIKNKLMLISIIVHC